MYSLHGTGVGMGSNELERVVCVLSRNFTQGGGLVQDNVKLE